MTSDYLVLIQVILTSYNYTVLRGDKQGCGMHVSTILQTVVGCY